MLTTKEWAESLDVCSLEDVPAIADYSEKSARTSREIAIRSLILQGVVAVAADVDPAPIVDWFKEQEIWQFVSRAERQFLEGGKVNEATLRRYQWHQEAEWTLLWTIQKVESLGLPTRQCDTRRMVDEIITPLGDPIDDFVETAFLRAPGELLAEDDRTYNLWCYLNQAKRLRKPVPSDLNEQVLYERRYAFEWLEGFQEWDDVTCDS
jgi:uncharacterized protein DUF4272